MSEQSRIKEAAERVVFMWKDKPHRMKTLMRMKKHLSPDMFSELLGDVWTSVENLYMCAGLRHTLRSKHFVPECFMSAEELEVYDEIKSEATVKLYRGTRLRNMGRTASVDDCDDVTITLVDYSAGDLSWTRSKETAMWFAQREASLHEDLIAHVIEATVDTRNVIAYKAKEDEVIVIPSYEGFRVTEFVTVNAEARNENYAFYAAVQRGLVDGGFSIAERLMVSNHYMIETMRQRYAKEMEDFLMFGLTADAKEAARNMKACQQALVSNIKNVTGGGE